MFTNETIQSLNTAQCMVKYLFKVSEIIFTQRSNGCYFADFEQVSLPGITERQKYKNL